MTKTQTYSSNQVVIPEMQACGLLANVSSSWMKACSKKYFSTTNTLFVCHLPILSSSSSEGMRGRNKTISSENSITTLRPSLISKSPSPSWSIFPQFSQDLQTHLRRVERSFAERLLFLLFTSAPKTTGPEPFEERLQAFAGSSHAFYHCLNNITRGLSENMCSNFVAFSHDHLWQHPPHHHHLHEHQAHCSNLQLLLEVC